jgi:hypothetical protein
MNSDDVTVLFGVLVFEAFELEETIKKYCLTVIEVAW